MKNSEVYILGNLGYVKNQLDGQIAKTRNLLKLLQNKNIGSIDYFDTQVLRFKPIMIFQMFWKLIRTRRVFYLGAQGSVKYILPVVWLVAKMLRAEIHYFVIGGWIAEFIKRKPLHKFILRRINGIYCETESLVGKLSDWYGYKHVIWLPNIRIHNFIPDIKYNEQDPLRLVFMARIAKSKGYNLIFRLAERIKRSLPENSIIIDFFGPIIETDRAEFFGGVSGFDFIDYKGMLNPDEIFKTLATYDVMLFPTSYIGEGFPGTILDSYISGIPVVASDWKYNSELVINGQTGFLFDLKNEEDFVDKILRIYNDRDLLYRLKRNAFQKSKEYSSDKIWSIIKRETGLKDN